MKLKCFGLTHIVLIIVSILVNAIVINNLGYANAITIVVYVLCVNVVGLPIFIHTLKIRSRELGINAKYTKRSILCFITGNIIGILVLIVLIKIGIIVD
jgi:hypothetical protein